MAHLSFDSVSDGVTDVESSSVLTVHSLLNSETYSQLNTVKLLEEDDIIQCGKCKENFTSISIFLSHKKICNSAQLLTNESVSSIQIPQSTISQNTILVRKIQMPSFLGSGYAQNLVLTDADLSLERAFGLHTQNVVTNLDVTHDDGIGSNLDSNTTLQTSIQQVVPQIQSLPSLESSGHSISTLELPLNNSKLISGQLLLMSQPNDGSGISSVVLNIGDSPFVESNDNVIENTDFEKTDQLIQSNQNVNEELSTANVIAEFHSSMVKSKKLPAEIQNNDDTSKREKLNCAYCSKTFMKNFDLQQHIRSHTGEKPFQCIVCGRAFAQKSNVKKHMQTHKVWPDGLSRTLPQFDRMNCLNGTEERTVIDAQPPAIVLANDEEQFDEPTEKDYACPYCSYVGQTYYSLKSHMKEHDTKKVYKCIVSSCGLLFNDLDPYLEHTKTHENEMTYRCHECNTNFSSLCELGAHQYSHSLYPNQRTRNAKKYFRCTMCLNKYSTPAALNHHMATSPHIYSCYYCDKVFPCERYLRRHLRIHSESQTFVCKLCNKTFKAESYLKVHMVTHSDIKPYQCNLCESRFNRKDKLKRHRLIHEPVKRFKCPFRNHVGCAKEFNRADKLKAHILTHSCVKPYVCRTCGRNFTRLFLLREHTKTHKNLKNTSDKCEHCGELLSKNKDSEEHHCEGQISDLNPMAKAKKPRNSSRKRQRNFKSSFFVNSRSRFRRSMKSIEEVSRMESETPDIPDDVHIEIISTTDDLVSAECIEGITLTDNFNCDSAQEQFEDPDQCDTNSFVTSTLQLPSSNYDECETLQCDM